MGDEFGLTAPVPPKKTRRAKVAGDGAVPRCFDRWHELYTLRWGMAPKHLAPGAAVGQFKRLVETYGEAEVMRLMALFFASKEWKITRGGYTVVDFYSAVPMLALADRRPASGDSRTDDNISAAMAATRKK